MNNWERRYRDLRSALEPFVDLRHQKQAWGVVFARLSDLAPITVTVTKAQLRRAAQAFNEGVE